MAKIKLVLDSGHGGRDTGGGSNKDYKEKDFVLKISKYQQKRFEELGIEVVMTRTTDMYIDSTPRAALVKNSGAQYCISNHINAGGGNGAETIHSIHTNGKLAQTLLDEIKSEGQKVRRAFSKANNAGGDYYFMHRLTGSVETIIVEYAFADTKEDSDRLIKNWEKYAEAVVRGFCKHVGVKYLAPYKSSKPKPSPSPAKPKPTPIKPTKLKITGVLDKATITALQKYLGTKEDGFISKPYSSVVAALQKFLGTTVDGFISTPYSSMVAALQRRFGTTVDGFISEGYSLVIAELQKRLNKGKL